MISMNTENRSIGQSRTRWPFPGLIFILLGMNIAVVAATVYFATTDRSFAVEPDYYQKAVHWDDTARQDERNRDLGWQVEAAPIVAGQQIVLHLRNQRGEAIPGALMQMVAFHNADASNRLTTTLDEIEPGMYRSKEALMRSGSWEIRVTAHAEGEIFTAKLNLDVRTLNEAVK